MLRPDATVPAGDVKLKNVCRWSDADAAAFAAVADLTVARLPANRGCASVTIQDLRATLRDAGVNLALVSVAGATACAVNRADVAADDRAALQDWIDSHAAPAAAVAPAAPIAPSDPGAAASPRPPEASAPAIPESVALSPAAARPVTAADAKPFPVLRDLLAADVATRLQLDPAAVQMTFSPADEKVLNLAEPYFKFNLTPRRVRDLGEVSWEVLILAGDTTQKVTVDATARAWQTQSVLGRPLAYRQVIRDEDVVEKRALVDRLPDEPLLARRRPSARRPPATSSPAWCSPPAWSTRCCWPSRGSSSPSA